MGAQPRISFGIIVLNGEPFLRYNLRALYPFAHQIIVVEGAVTAAAGIATAGGHSKDATLAELARFQDEEDPEGKVEIIVREGFWAEKTEQSQAYAARATGDYLWQVDVDEFYRREDMQAVIDLLTAQPQITTVSFPQITYWARPDYVTDGWYLRLNAHEINRIFKWAPGSQYISHRPPVVVDAEQEDLRRKTWIRAREMAAQGIFIHHYSLVFPQQVEDKCIYYESADWVARNRHLEWAENSYFTLKRPFRVHNVYHYPSWLERAKKEPPAPIQGLFADIDDGRFEVRLRPVADVEKLLRSPWYRLARAFLRLMILPAGVVIFFRRFLKEKLAKQ